MIVYGGDDSVLGISSAEDLVNFANSEKFIIPQAGHQAYVEKPDEFHQYVYNFLLSIYKHH